MTPNRNISPSLVLGGAPTNASSSTCHLDGSDFLKSESKCDLSGGGGGALQHQPQSLTNLSGCYMKKSKRDPIVEYDTELAESIEYELGLKKQNGPR